MCPNSRSSWTARDRLTGMLTALGEDRKGVTSATEPDEVKAVITRLKRANGHLAAVIRMLEEGSECEDALITSLP